MKLQDGILCPIDSHWPIEKFKAIDDAYQNKDKQSLADAKKTLASAFRDKAKKVAQKYISQPKTTDFAIIYVPTEGLFSELAKSIESPSIPSEVWLTLTSGSGKAGEIVV